MLSQQGEQDRWRKDIEERHAAMQYATLTTIVEASELGVFEIVHSIARGRDILYRRGLADRPFNPGAARFLIEKQIQLKELALQSDRKEDQIYARSGTSFNTRLLNALGHHILRCGASQEQSVAIEAHLAQSFDDLRSFSRSPDRLITDFTVFRAGLCCGLAQAS